MKRFLITLLFCLITHLLFCENPFAAQVHDAAARWDRDKLLLLRDEILKGESLGGSDFFLLAKICYKLAFIEKERNNGRFNESIRNTDPDNPGLLDQACIYGEEAFKADRTNTELVYYLARSYLHLIRTAGTYFRYKDKKNFYVRILGQSGRESHYNALYNAYYHSTYDTRAGAKRNKGDFFKAHLESGFRDDDALTVLAEIYYTHYRFDEAQVYCLEGLGLTPGNLILQRLLRRIEILKEGPVVRSVVFEETDGLSEKLLRRFVKTRPGQTVTRDLVQKLEKSVQRHRLVDKCSVDYAPAGEGRADLVLTVTSAVRRIINVNIGYELYVEPDPERDPMDYVTSIVPPVFYLRDNNIFKRGFCDLEFIGVVGFLWDAKLTVNLFEILDLRAGFEVWDFPFFNKLRDNSAGWTNRVSLAHCYIEPSVGLFKTFGGVGASVGLEYAPRFYVMMEDPAMHVVEAKKRYRMPPGFFTMHTIKLSAGIDLVNPMEGGWVREGFAVKGFAAWSKMTPDTVYSYNDYPDYRGNLSFQFGLYGEYSKFVKELFYFSVGLTYRGGLNHYKYTRFKLGKGNIGTPFGSQLKVHGFEDEAYRPEHLVLLNILMGWKASRYFHPGLFLDVAAFVERHAATYLAPIPGTEIATNLIIGLGSFFKWTPGWMFDIAFEASFGIDTGAFGHPGPDDRARVVRGPVLGLFLMKTFIFE